MTYYSIYRLNSTQTLMILKTLYSALKFAKQLMGYGDIYIVKISDGQRVKCYDQNYIVNH